MASASTFLDEPPKASDFLDAPAKPVASQFLDQPTIQEQAQKMASDPNVDTYQHAAQNPADFEAAFQAQKLRDNRPFLQKVGAGLSTLAKPSTYTGAAKGVKNFVTGAWQAIVNDPIAATYYHMTGDPRALTKQAEATLAGQQAEQSVRHTIDATAGNLGNSSAKYPAGLYDSGEIPADVSDEQQKQNAEDIDRRAFQDKVDAAKRAQQLAQGRPLDSGFIAGIYGAGGQVPSQEVSPEALQNAGSPAVDQAAIERSAAIADPNNILLGMAPELPGAGYVGGKLTQGAGKALQIPGRIVSAIPGKIGKSASGVAGASIAAAETALHSPATAAGVAAGVGASKGLQWLGQGLEQQGKAAAEGIPSALDTTAANARMAGESALGTNAQRTIGNAATRGAQTAIGMAPVNAALSEGDPEQFARSEVGAAAFGGAMDALASHRPALVEAARPALRQKGLEGLDMNSREGRASSDYIQSLPPDQQNTILELNGALGGLPVQTTRDETVPARMIVLPSDQFQQQMQQLGIQNGPKSAAGFFWDGNGTAYINGESSSFNSDPGQVAGHEFGGHAAMNMLEAAGAKGGPIYDGLLSSAKQELYNPDGTPTGDFQKFIDAYNKKFDPSGQTRAIDPANQNSVEEFLAETAGRIISQKGAGEISVPKNILDRITDGVGRFMSSFSGVNPDSVGTGGHFDRTEVAKLSKEVRDSLIQLSGTKLRPQEGEGAISSPQTPEQYVQELQDTLAKPRPTDTAENVKAWVKEQAQAKKDLADFQGAPQSSFPASGKPPVAPSAPLAPPNPAKADAVKAIQQLGAKPAEANQLVEAAATALGGTPNASDLLTAAMKIKGGGKVQPQPVPANVHPAPQTATQPVSESSVVATQGPVAATAEAPKVPNETAAPVAGGEGTPKITAEDAARVANEAERAAIAKERNPNIKAAQARIKAAKIDALASTADQSGLHKETDEFGNTKIVGNFDPANPIHQELAKIGGLTPEASQKLQEIQGLQGKPVYLRYRSAKSDTQGSGGEGTAKGVGDMNVRQEEYAKDPAAQRTEGTIQQKVVIPLNTEMSTKSGELQANYFTLDNILHNAASIFEGMKSAGIDNPYGATAKEQESQLIPDTQAYALNHANGWRGDGAAPMKGFPDSNLPKPNPDYQPTVIPKERFDVLNMMLHNESASRLGELSKRMDDYKAAGKNVPPSYAAAYKRAQEAAALAGENNQPIDPISGETNQLRAKLKSAGFDTNKSFKSPFETLSPQHILDVSERPIMPQEGDVPTVRPTGFDSDPAQLAKNGLPNQKAVAAGFLPDDVYYRGTPTDDWKTGDETGTVWLTNDKNAASDYSKRHGGQSPTITAARINSKNQLDLWNDFNGPATGKKTLLNILQKSLPSDSELKQNIPEISKDNEVVLFDLLRDPEVVDALKYAGYDSVKINDDNGIRTHTSVGVFDPNKIAPVKTERASFLPDESRNERPTVDWEEFDKDGNSKGKTKIEGLSQKEQDAYDVAHSDPGNYEILERTAPALKEKARMVSEFDKGDSSTWDQSDAKSKADAERFESIKSALRDSDSLLEMAGDETQHPDDITEPDRGDFEDGQDGKEAFEKAMSEYRDQRAQAKTQYNSALVKSKAKLRSEMQDLSNTAKEKYSSAKDDLDSHIADAKAEWRKVKADPRFRGFSNDDFTDLMDASYNALEAKPGNAQFSPDSGKPAEGDSPAERLAREAEQAGVQMKADEIIGLMRNDENVMNAIRAKIQKRTGKRAEFSPSDSESRSPSSKPFAPLASILAQQRKKEREMAGASQ